MPNIGPVELIIILVIALIVIGPGRLPDVGAALGKSIREFRKASTEVSDATRIDAAAPSSAQTASTTPAAAIPPSAAPAPTPQPPSASPTSMTVPAPVVTPPTPPSDDEATNLPA